MELEQRRELDCHFIVRGNSHVRGFTFLGLLWRILELTLIFICFAHEDVCILLLYSVRL